MRVLCLENGRRDPVEGTKPSKSAISQGDAISSGGFCSPKASGNYEDKNVFSIHSASTDTMTNHVFLQESDFIDLKIFVFARAAKLTELNYITGNRDVRYKNFFFPETKF